MSMLVLTLARVLALVLLLALVLVLLLNHTHDTRKDMSPLRAAGVFDQRSACSPRFWRAYSALQRFEALLHCCHWPGRPTRGHPRFHQRLSDARSAALRTWPYSSRPPAHAMPTQESPAAYVTQEPPIIKKTQRCFSSQKTARGFYI